MRSKVIALLITLASILTGYAIGITDANNDPVCWSKTEDSVMIGCDYRNGAWYREDG